jgi:hypothetical protein
MLGSKLLDGRIAHVAEALQGPKPCSRDRR